MGGDAGASGTSVGTEGTAVEPDDLQRALAALAERAQKLDVSSHESAAPEELAPLISDATHLVDEALAVIRDVEKDLGLRRTIPPDEPCEVASAGLLAEVEQVLEGGDGIERVLDLAFVTRLGLGQRRQALCAPRLLEDKWDAIAECSSAVREVSKALSALEIAYAHHRGAPSCSRYYLSELDRSRRIRHVYARFRRDVHALGEPTPETVKTALRRASAAIAKLAGRDVYVSARVHDRRMLRELQERIARWIRAEASADDASSTTLRTEGLRLYRDLSNITELLMGVNRRAELVIHDRQLIASVLVGLSTLEPDDRFEIARRAPELGEVPGRHATLDTWLAAGDSPSVSELTDVLVSILALLRGESSRTGLTPAWGISRPRARTDRPGWVLGPSTGE